MEKLLLRVWTLLEVHKEQGKAEWHGNVTNKYKMLGDGTDIVMWHNTGIPYQRTSSSPAVWRVLICSLLTQLGKQHKMAQVLEPLALKVGGLGGIPGSCGPLW